MDPNRPHLKSGRLFSRSGKLIFLTCAYGLVAVGTIQWVSKMIQEYEEHKGKEGAKVSVLAKFWEIVDKAKCDFLGVQKKK